MRLNVYLQRAGVGSRRDAERLVEQGRISINGRIASPTTPVAAGDTVLLDGRPVSPAPRSQPRIFLLYKPLDVLVTSRDPQGRKTIFELSCLRPPAWGKDKPRLITVGRLDVNSEGLLVMTDDGELAQRMMRPATALARVYRVRVKGRLTDRQIAELKRGVTVDGVRYRGADICEEEGLGGRSNSWYRVTLREGKNREIRKLFEHYGCLVNRLIRIQFGPFELGKLKSGELREVPPALVKRFVGGLELAAAKASVGRG